MTRRFAPGRATARRRERITSGRETFLGRVNATSHAFPSPDRRREGLGEGANGTLRLSECLDSRNDYEFPGSRRTPVTDSSIASEQSRERHDVERIRAPRG